MTFSRLEGGMKRRSRIEENSVLTGLSTDKHLKKGGGDRNRKERSEKSDRRKSLVSPLKKARIYPFGSVLKVYRTSWLSIDSVVHPCYNWFFQGKKEKRNKISGEIIINRSKNIVEKEQETREGGEIETLPAFHSCLFFFFSRFLIWHRYDNSVRNTGSISLLSLYSLTDMHNR